MGMYLIAASSGIVDWILFGGHILLAAIGLGTVIFVHELGHFLVAKACGVKCEKFYIGFDFYGLKLWHRKWGETEYGIGVFPLGGYVKMLGQDDNPARAADERERSMAHQAEHSGDLPPEPTRDERTYDPRSYMAQSVPKRMAIISAGVIMNVIFAFVAASVAYGLGVEYMVCGTSGVTPGEAAWQAGMLPSDKIVQIGPTGPEDNELRFQDLFSGVALGDLDEGIQLKVRRRGVEQPISFTVRPDKEKTKLRGRPTIGALQPVTTSLNEKFPVSDFSAAAVASQKFQGNDRVVAIKGQKIEDFGDVIRELAQHPDLPLQVTVERKKGEKPPENEQTEEVVITVPPRPMKTLGCTMGWGPIVAIQDGSPAKEADLRVGDRLLKLDGKPLSEGPAPADPLRLPDILRQQVMSGKKQVTITIQRKEGNQDVQLDKTVTLVEPLYYDQKFDNNSPIDVPELGIAYSVLNTIAGVEPGSPAEQKGIKPGDQLVKAVIKDQDADTHKDAEPLTFEFDEKNLSWPAFVNALQFTSSVAKVDLAVLRNKETVKVELTPSASESWYYPGRGFHFDPLTQIRRAHSLGDALQLGLRETKDSLLIVYRIMQKVGTGQLSVGSNFGGPVQIGEMAFRSAQSGLSVLLIFLTMLSANLAVINFLPIPILDGGHMMFLLYEGIRGKPASERVMTTLTYFGLILILCLMVLVIGLDINKYIK